MRSFVAFAFGPPQQDLFSATFRGNAWTKRRLGMTVGLKVGLGGEHVAGMNTQSDRHNWFVLIDGQRRGPLTYDDLTRAAQESLISADTPVWRSGWKNWHPARSVKGLVVERTPAPASEHQIDERQVSERAASERAVNEAPLAPDDTGWTDEQVGAPAEEAYQYAPPQHRDARRSQPPPQSQDMVALRWEQQQQQQPEGDNSDHIFADEWRMLAEQRPGQDRGRAVAKAASVPVRVARKAPAAAPDDDFGDDFAGRDDRDYRPALRGETADEKPIAAQIGAFFRRAAIGVGAVLLLAGGGWVFIQSGAIKSLRSTAGSRLMLVSSSDLSSDVANLPAVMALQRNDPAAFERFKKRYADSAVNARKDEEMTLARNALRKSVKHLLAISPGDVLLDITETSLSYLQGLQSANPETCVWLSDDNKGARLTSNLAKDLPMPYMREMSVLERIASINPHMAIAPMSDEEARPYFERVLATLRRQNVKTDLQARERLDPSEFAPYCALVIAFYQAVLELPRDDKINVLRNLYAKAAVNADSDIKK
jgi:hypothetical protein